MAPTRLCHIAMMKRTWVLSWAAASQPAGHPEPRTQITADPEPKSWVQGHPSQSCEITERRVWDSNPRGSSRLLAIFKTCHAVFLTCTDALPKDSLGAYSARSAGHRIVGLTVPA